MSSPSSSARSTNLPVPLTPLVGREREVAALVTLLHQDSFRLVTLTGPGGVGKTRLALQVAANVIAAFPDGVWFVGLAPITDPDLIASAIARTFGIQEPGDESLVKRLKAYLRDKHLLLVLDNFEHVVEAVPLVADMLGGCPSLTVLVTSRTRLQLYGEREHVVPPLAMPDENEPRSVDDVLGSEAVRLFVARAQAVKEDFALTSENAHVVLDICRRLDGLPLAIELAAARIKILTPAALLARLEYRLPLLTGGGRDLPTRQQTMRDALAWSYDLLTAEEQILFRKLSVFVGGFSFDAAEWMTGSQGVRVTGRAPPRPPDTLTPRHPDTSSVLDGIASLVDKSLLHRRESPDPEPRFGMLETIREFGWEQLVASGEFDNARARHAAYILALAEAVEPEVTGPQQGMWLTRLEMELDNMRLALAWALEGGTDRVETALRLAVAAWPFWYMSGRSREGRDRLQGAIAATDDAPTSTRAKAFTALGTMCATLGDFTRAESVLQQATAIAQAAGSVSGEALALQHLAITALQQGDARRASSLLDEALRLHGWPGDVAPEDRRWVAVALTALASCEIERGNLDRGVELCEQALALQRELESPPGVALALALLGGALRSRGDVASALACYREGLTLSAQQHDKWLVLENLTGLAAVSAAEGPPQQAARLLGVVEALREQIGASVPRLHAGHENAVAPARARLGEAKFATLQAAGRTLPLDEAIASALASPAPAGSQSVRADTVPGPLTPRQREVAALIARGLTNRQIAATLFIAERTADTHVAHILASLGLHSRAEVAAWAVDYGLAADASLD